MYVKEYFPQQVSMEGSIHKDSHENSVIQCSTRCNDSWITLHMLLFHLYNSGDKPIVLSWVSRPPKIDCKKEAGFERI